MLGHLYDLLILFQTVLAIDKEIEMHSLELRSENYNLVIFILSNFYIAIVMSEWDYQSIFSLKWEQSKNIFRVIYNYAFSQEG